LLGISFTDIDPMIESFSGHPLNKYCETFFEFLRSCVHYGCGEYYQETKIQFDELLLQSIRKRELNEVVVPKRLPNYVRLPDKEILKIDNELFFIKNTSRNAKKDGVNYGKIYSVSEYTKPDIAGNWFNFSSQIETRVDILLSIECSRRKI
jgi:hypothetical protein